MTFIASKALWALVAPGNLLALLLAVGAVLLFLRPAWARRVGRGMVAVAAAGFLALAIVPVGDRLMAGLEDRFPAPTLPQRVDGIVLLGGAVNPLLSLDRGQPSLNQAADRITAFVELARRYPEAKLVFTGGSGSLLRPDLAEAPVVRRQLEALGLDPARVVFESESRNTWENAVFSRRLVAPGAGENWVLVTSAYHMPRSVGIFRLVGWPVLPYPVDYRTAVGNRGELRFDLSWGLDLATDALREWVGLAAYRLMGRTDALFPGPDDGPGRDIGWAGEVQRSLPIGDRR